MKQRFSQLISLLLVLSVFLRPVSLIAAEAATRGDGANTISTDGPDQAIKPVQVPKAQSRSSDSGAATALAIVGAMTAMAMCAKLMKDAREAKAEGDDKSAQLYTMMAMQQCQQGAQNMANAAKNKEQKDNLKENQTPEIAALSSQKAIKLPEGPKDTIDQAGLEPQAPLAEVAPLPDPEVAPLVTRETNLSDNNGSNSPIPPSYTRPGDGIIVPDLIDKAKITGNESAKGTDEAGNLSASNNLSNSFAGSLRVGTNSSDLKGSAATDTHAADTVAARGINKGGSEGSGEGANSTSGKSSENGDSGPNLNDMMAGLFGGGASGAPGGFAGAQGLIDYTPVPTSPSTGKKMNIFEAASYLYKQAHGKKVKRIKIAKNFAPLTSSQILTLSK